MALEERDVCMTDQRLSYHLRLAEYDGLLCSDAGAGCAFPDGIVLALRAAHSLALFGIVLGGVAACAFPRSPRAKQIGARLRLSFRVATWQPES